MRISFSSLNRPKKIAKSIQRISEIKLSVCQNETAKASGYRDWDQLKKTLVSNTTNRDLSDCEFSKNLAEFIHKIAMPLKINSGAILHAISNIPLVENTKPNSYVATLVRAKLFEMDELPKSPKRTRGAIGKLKIAGRNGEAVILREYLSPIKGKYPSRIKVITHGSRTCSLVGDQYSSPSQSLPLFIPMRLYIPYGKWIEQDGSTVLFSRDYFPLWRIRNNCPPERIAPWDWIDVRKEVWFWNEVNPPWEQGNTLKSELNRLDKFGVCSTPLLVEALPLIVNSSKHLNYSDASTELKKSDITL